MNGLDDSKALWDEEMESWEEICTRFPYLVRHKIDYGTSEWHLMIAWLTTNIGKQQENWHGLTTYMIRFQTELDAISFQLAWT